MKPEAPAEIRGEFQPIATSVPGYRVCEHLPLIARQAAPVRGGAQRPARRPAAQQRRLRQPDRHQAGAIAEHRGGPGPAAAGRPSAVRGGAHALRPRRRRGCRCRTRSSTAFTIPARRPVSSAPAASPLWLRPDPEGPGIHFPEFELPEGVSVSRVARPGAPAPRHRTGLPEAGAVARHDDISRPGPWTW